MPPSNRRLVTLNDAAAYASVSTKTIRRWIASGYITGYRLGKRSLRVDLNDLEALARPVPTTGQSS